MDITHIKSCADFFQQNYLNTFYFLITYSGKSFMLIGEEKNFPHLMGIHKNTYRSNGYRNPKFLYRDIISGNQISTRIIPNSISPTSKMYKKAANFSKSTDIFWKNTGPITINYDPALSTSHLNNVDILLTDINTGYMLGWVFNNQISINGNLQMKKYCLCSWIDESSGNTQNKEKYMPNQDVELVRYVFALDTNSNLIRKKEYTYDYAQKLEILNSCSRNSNNLLVDSVNEHRYIEIALNEAIPCKINGKQY